jgi:hypothetical protein
MAQATIMGRAAGAGVGDPQDLSAAQVAAIVQAVIDHGALAGLGDDDHPFYILISGARALTGDWDIGEDRRIKAETFRARDNEGLALENAAGSVVLLVADSGRIGIGQSLPNQLLEVAAALTGAAGAHAGAPVLRLTQKANTSYNIGDVHSGIEFYSEDVGGSLPGITGYIRAITTRGNGITNADAGLVFGTSNGSGGTAVDRLAIDTNGFVSIGTLTPIGKLTLDAETNCYIFVCAHGTGVEAGLALYATRGTAAAPTATQAGDVLGSLYFQGWDTARSTGARIYAVAAAEWGTAGSATDSPTDLRFATVPDGSSTLIDRLVLTSAGLVGIATTAPTLSDGLGLDVNGKLLRLRINKTPATSSAPGNPGELCADDNYLYRYCTNQWKRIPWSTF